MMLAEIKIGVLPSQTSGGHFYDKKPSCQPCGIVSGNTSGHEYHYPKKAIIVMENCEYKCT